MTTDRRQAATNNSERQLTPTINNHRQPHTTVSIQQHCNERLTTTIDSQHTVHTLHTLTNIYPSIHAYFDVNA
jgi:hypothetical protein